MKRVIIYGVLLGLMASCGPRRLGCGPGRCETEVIKCRKQVTKPC